ncbi:MAG: nucleoside recognition protein [Lachnospiraceae bacterium]|nr:nucleoside recognition protein [Lachnospiraceae bacterium]
MLNYLWGGMILLGVIFSIVNGTTEAVSEEFVTAAGEAVSLTITLFGVMSLWTGLMEIAKSSGVLEKMQNVIRPLIRFLFPDLPQNHPAGSHIAVNMISNFLGLGNAALPAGIRAMESLAELEEEKTGLRRASDEMCTFLVLNISSLQLIPVNMIAYRSQYGSVSPSAIVGPAIIATAVSTLTAIIFCKIVTVKRKR